MVGGLVIEVIHLPDRIWVNVQNRTIPKETCALYVARSELSERIAAGDSLWWQGRYAFWTPADGSVIEQPFPRSSYSGVPRPEVVIA